MWHNHIGDDGIAAIAGSLRHSRITLLDVKKCGISIGGVRSLAAVFQNVREIDIGSNPITVDGARLIMKSAVENGVCEYVWICLVVVNVVIVVQYIMLVDCLVVVKVVMVVQYIMLIVW